MFNIIKVYNEALNELAAAKTYQHFLSLTPKEKIKERKEIYQTLGENAFIHFQYLKDCYNKHKERL